MMNTVIIIGFLVIVGFIVYNMMTKKETAEQAAVDTAKEAVAAAEPVANTVVAEVKAEAPVVETKVEEVAAPVVAEVKAEVAAVETKVEEAVTEVAVKIKKPRTKKAK
jgi:ribonuclease E